jgi:hypothetical protein
MRGATHCCGFNVPLGEINILIVPDVASFGGHVVPEYHIFYTRVLSGNIKNSDCGATEVDTKFAG